MGQVLLTALADALGGAIPSNARFQATASGFRAAGETVTAPRSVTATITDGVPDVPLILDVLPVDMYWTIQVSFPRSGRSITRYVQVPHGDVEWADLIDIDRATMQPDPGAVPAWTAAIAQVQAALDEVRESTVTATIDPADPDVLLISYPNFQTDPSDDLILVLPIGA